MEQTQGLVKSSFKLPGDPKKISGKIILGLILAAVGLFVYVKILPTLISIVWGTTELAIGLGVLGMLALIVTNKRFQRGIGYICQFIAEWTLGLAIEMNPWAILNNQLDAAEEDRTDLLKQKTTLEGQSSKLSTQLDAKNDLMKQSAKEVEILKQKGSSIDPDGFQMETSQNNYTNAKSFIDQVMPINNDLQKLIAFADKAYRKSGYALQNARSTLKIQRETWEAVTVGQNAMNKAMRAFAGRPELASDADKALDMLRADVARKIGGIKTAIQFTADQMNTQDLHDAAKIELAAKSAENYNLDAQFDYMHSVGDTSAIKLDDKATVTGNNKYLDFLKK